MRHLGKILFLGFIVAFGIMGALKIRSLGSAQDFEKATGLYGVTRSLEAIRLRSAYPTMDPEVLARRAEEGATQKGLLGVLAGMNKRDVAPVTDTPAQNAVSAGPAGSAPATTSTATTGVTDTPNTATSASETPLESTGRLVKLGDSADGKEVYGVVHAPGPEDFNAVDRINALHISDEMKAKILHNYEVTGVLPEILTREKQRQPATSAPTGAPSEEL